MAKKKRLTPSAPKMPRSPALHVPSGLAGPKAPKAKTQPGDEGMLKKYLHHNAMADHHRAQADLVRAKLRVKGKRIDEYGDSPAGTKPRKPRIVNDF